MGIRSDTEGDSRPKSTCTANYQIYGPGETGANGFGEKESCGAGMGSMSQKQNQMGSKSAHVATSGQNL